MYIIDDHPLVRSAIAMLLRRMRSSTKVIELDKFSELQAAIIKNGEPSLFVLLVHVGLSKFKIGRLKEAPLNQVWSTPM